MEVPFCSESQRPQLALENVPAHQMGQMFGVPKAGVLLTCWVGQGVMAAGQR